MTIKGDTICSLIQSFPALLILAQKFNQCLHTPFVYKPPTPTPSTEYYEALDALFHTLFNQDCHYGKNYPCHDVPQHPGYNGYAYGHPTYVYKKANIYNISKPQNYAPNQVYNVKRYRIVVKKGHGKRRSERMREGRNGTDTASSVEELNRISVEDSREPTTRSPLPGAHSWEPTTPPTQ